jgi:hypothetical protein
MFWDVETSVRGQPNEYSLLEWVDFRSLKTKKAVWIDLFKRELLVSSSSGKVLHGESMRAQNEDS